MARVIAEPEPETQPLRLSTEETYKSLSVIRRDLAENRGKAVRRGRVGCSRALLLMAAAVVLLVVYVVSNNFAKTLNETIYGKIGALAVGDRKPTLMGSTYSVARDAGEGRHIARVTDSIFGGRNLTLQAPSEPSSQNTPHKDEKYRFYYVFEDNNSDGTLDAVFQVREQRTTGNRLLGRYQKPLRPTPVLQHAYERAAKTFAEKTGLIEEVPEKR